VRQIIFLACLAAIAGCGGSSPSASRPASTPTPAPAASEPKARELVFFQRQGAAGATLDTLSVRADGTATHEMRYGGAGGRFREYVLRDGVLARIRRALARLPGGSTMTRGSPPPGGAQYLLRLQGRTLTGRAGGIAAPARPAVALLDGVIDGHGVAGSKLVTQTHSR